MTESTQYVNDGAEYSSNTNSEFTVRHSLDDRDTDFRQDNVTYMSASARAKLVFPS